MKHTITERNLNRNSFRSDEFFEQLPAFVQHLEKEWRALISAPSSDPKVQALMRMAHEALGNLIDYHLSQGTSCPIA